MAPPLDVSHGNSTIENTLDSVKDPKWQKNFPSCVGDFANASRFMLRAMYVAFSFFLRNRKILDPKFFAMNYICENIKACTLNHKLPESAEIAQCIRTAGEAIIARHLEEFALVISKADYEEEALEVLSFKIHYDAHGNPSANMSTGSGSDNVRELARIEYTGTENVRRELVKIVQCINLLCKKILKPLPSDYSANFRVAYTSDTPASYRIAGFADHANFYKPHPDSNSVVVGGLRPAEVSGLMECSSIFIEDVARAEKNILALSDKLAKQMGFEVNNDAYNTFQTSINTTTESPASRIASNVDAAVNEVAANLTETLNVNAKTPKRGPERVESPESSSTESAKSPPKKTGKPRPSPYGRVTSMRRRSDKGA